MTRLLQLLTALLLATLPPRGGAAAQGPPRGEAPAPFYTVLTVGEVTQGSAILQARLGAAAEPVDGDVPG